MVAKILNFKLISIYIYKNIYNFKLIFYKTYVFTGETSDRSAEWFNGNCY